MGVLYVNTDLQCTSRGVCCQGSYALFTILYMCIQPDHITRHYGTLKSIYRRNSRRGVALGVAAEVHVRYWK